MHVHTEVPFYTAVFFVLMNKDRFATFPADIQSATDAQSGEALADRFGQLWNKWDEPVRAGASGPGQTVIKPDDAATLAAWKQALAPVTDSYLTDLAAHGYPAARATYDQLVAMLSTP